jgi:hypothetical protein
MKNPRILASEKLAKDLCVRADTYGGDAVTQSILNHFRKLALECVELEKENIKTAYEDGLENGFQSNRKPHIPATLYFNNNYEQENQ